MGLKRRKRRKKPTVTGISRGTTTLRFPQGRDRRGRFTARKVIALADWIDSPVYPPIVDGPRVTVPMRSPRRGLRLRGIDRTV